MKIRKLSKHLIRLFDIYAKPISLTYKGREEVLKEYSCKFVDIFYRCLIHCRGENWYLKP